MADDKKEKKTKTQGGTKRVAEDEGDDEERSDRKSWKNYVEPAVSNQAHIHISEPTRPY